MSSTLKVLSAGSRLVYGSQPQRALSSLTNCFADGRCQLSPSYDKLSPKILCPEKRLSMVHLSQPVRHAGHSKWQNIRHTKTAKDLQRSNHINRMNSKLKIAIREGGGTNPAFNFQLARVIAQAEASDVPKSNIENAIKQVMKTKDKGSLFMVEAHGPGFSSLMIETFTEKQMMTRQTIQSILKLFNCRVENTGNAMRSFDEKGILQVELPESDEEVDMDKYTDVAIEVGAEDVEKFTDSDDKSFLKFICGKKDLHVVKKNLEAEGYTVPYAKLEFIAHTFVQLSPAELEACEVLFDKLESHESVVRIFDNIEEAT